MLWGRYDARVQHDILAVLLCSYRMDYLKFVEHHRATNADITIGCLPVDYERASDFGLMKIDDEGRIFVSISTAHAPAIDLHPEPHGRLAGSAALQRHDTRCLSPHVTVPSCEPPCDVTATPAGLCREAQGRCPGEDEG